MKYLIKCEHIDLLEDNYDLELLVSFKGSSPHRLHLVLDPWGSHWVISGEPEINLLFKLKYGWTIPAIKEEEYSTLISHSACLIGLGRRRELENINMEAA